jgi:hypothetical protein
MNQSLINIGTLLNNPHFRYPLLVVIGIQLAEIWFPQFKDQLSASQKLIMFYVIAAAANTTPSQSAKTQMDNPPGTPIYPPLAIKETPSTPTDTKP